MSNGTTSQAHAATLDLILALYRAPSLRAPLREQALPADVDLIIRLAAGSEIVLGSAAQSADVPRATLLEAARFYVQQILLEPGTNAYRVLGVTPGDPFTRIRDHHHWLQRWLHPDRNDDGNATYAARLNWAWQHLRNDAARAAYDAAHHADVTPLPKAPGVAMHWTAIPVARRRPIWPYATIAAIACTGGALILAYALGTSGTTPNTTRPTSASSQTAHVATAHPLRTRSLTEPAPTTRRAKPSSRPAEPIHHAPASALQRPRWVAHAIESVSAVQPQTDADRHPASDTIATARLPIAPKLRVAAATRAAVPAVDATTRAAAAKRVVAVPRKRASVVADAAPAATIASNAAEPAARVTQPAATKPDPARQRAAAATSLPPSTLLQRVELARERLTALLDYLQRAGDATPPWPEAAPPYNASLQRTALRARHPFRAEAVFTLDAPAWRITAGQATVKAEYFLHGHRRFIEQGHLELRMTWADGRWQMTYVQLEPSP